ncbi:MAG: cytochrome C oxidase subunit IV family protein [Planctomycetota bacterium]
MPHQHTHQETHHEKHAHHAVPLWLLIAVFGILMVLTLLTWAVTLVDFGYEINLMVAMAIALVKAAFVGLYFMHLRWDAPLNGFILVASLLFVTLFITFSLLDTGQTLDRTEAQSIRQSATQ